jgi:hypothetical protein
MFHRRVALTRSLRQGLRCPDGLRILAHRQHELVKVIPMLVAAGLGKPLGFVAQNQRAGSGPLLCSRTRQPQFEGGPDALFASGLTLSRWLQRVGAYATRIGDGHPHAGRCGLRQALMQKAHQGHPLGV